MLQLEVLICKLLAIDRLAASTLLIISICSSARPQSLVAYVMACEVSTLKHEVWNHSVEDRASVAHLWVCRLAECSEVLCCSGNDIIVELEVYAALLCCERMSVYVHVWMYVPRNFHMEGHDKTNASRCIGE